MPVSAPRSWFHVYDAAGESEAALRDAFVRDGATALRIVNASPAADPLPRQAPAAIA